MPGTAQSGKGELTIRVMDVVFSVLAMLVLLPTLAVIAGLIKLDSPGPVFFRQTRLGRGGREFSIYKFRTMVDGAERYGLQKSTARDDDRITHIGTLLRNWSIDEFPQLLNILKGEMSLVGPRPAFPEHFQAYTDRQKRRLRVPPGLTGWAQINGRNTLSWPDRIEHDLWYVEHRSWKLNLAVMWRTIPVLFNSNLVYGPVVNFDLGRHPAAKAATVPPEPAAIRTTGRCPDPGKRKVPLGI